MPALPTRGRAGMCGLGRHAEHRLARLTPDRRERPGRWRHGSPGRSPRRGHPASASAVPEAPGSQPRRGGSDKAPALCQEADRRDLPADGPGGAGRGLRLRATLQRHDPQGLSAHSDADTPPRAQARQAAGERLRVPTRLSAALQLEAAARIPGGPRHARCGGGARRTLPALHFAGRSPRVPGGFLRGAKERACRDRCFSSSSGRVPCST